MPDELELLLAAARENNFDFNDAVDSLTDDTWFLNRFRVGMKVTPAPFFSIYVQGQDTREWDSDRPNIIGSLGAEGDDSFFGHAYCAPQGFRFVIARTAVFTFEDGDAKPANRNFKSVDDQIPGVFDGFFFKIIAEGKISQHFKEGVVIRRFSHFIKIPCAETFL